MPSSTASPRSGRPTGTVKRAILAGNAARLYGIRPQTALGEIRQDQIAAIKAEYADMGGMRTNARYGYVARPRA